MRDDPFKIQEGTVRSAKVRGYSSNLSSGDYLDFFQGGSQQTLGKYFTEGKIFLLFSVFIVVLAVLWSRSFYLQIVKGQDFFGIAEGNRIREEIIQANRGLIYDRFGNLLVKNTSQFFLYLLDANKEEVSAEVLAKVAEVLAVSPESLTEQLKQPTKQKRILLYENVPYQQAIKLMLLSEKYPELEIDYEPRRQYFSYLGMSHALGYTGAVEEKDLAKGEYNYTDRLGKTGLELIYEKVLRGRNGIRQIEVDAFNQAKNVIAWTEPQDGNDLILAIDAKAQSKLYEVMASAAGTYDKQKMAAVVLDAHDGGVLAMVSLPTYDNNIFTTSLNREEYEKIITDPSTPLLNRAVAGNYPFGSVFKPIVAAAALEEKIVDKNFSVISTGGVTIGNNFFPDWRPAGHGRTNVTWALADSVNTYFYTIGGGNNQWLELGLGADKIVDYAKKFGLGKVTNLDFNSEAEGFIPTKEWKEENLGERWYLGDTYNLSIGQGYLLGTPLQIATMMSYFATGKGWQPHFIKETRLGDTVEAYQPKVALENLVSEDNRQIVRDGLRQTVVAGTAQSLQSVKVPVAGKTGTAQFNRNKIPHSWFASFAPFDNPEIVVVVLVEEGGDRGTAVTVARQFMEWYFDR